MRVWLCLKFVTYHFFLFSFLTSYIIVFIYFVKKVMNIEYDKIKNTYESQKNTVYVLQELPGTRVGRPKYNIIGAQKFGKLKVLLKEDTQIIMSPGPIIFELRRLLKDYTSDDYLLLSGDPSVIGIACSIVSDINNGKFNLLKWDRQEQMYYPLEINLHEKGKIDD